MKHNRFIIGTSIIGLAVLFLMLTLTSPIEIGPTGILVFFTTLYVVIFAVISLVMQAFFYFAIKKPALSRKEYLYSAILAFGPIMLLMARSFGAINLWTIALIILFLSLAEFLVYKRV